MKLLFLYVIRNAPEKVFIELKCIILILTIFIQFSLKCMFLPGQSGLSQNKLTTYRLTHGYVTFQCALSSTSLNAQLYILMGISYHTYNPSNVRRILTVYHTHGTENHKWIFTILCKATRRNTMGNIILRMKYKGYELYNTIIEYFDNYGAEGGAVSQ